MLGNVIPWTSNAVLIPVPCPDPNPVANPDPDPDPDPEQGSCKRQSIQSSSSRPLKSSKHDSAVAAGGTNDDVIRCCLQFTSSASISPMLSPSECSSSDDSNDSDHSGRCDMTDEG